MTYAKLSSRAALLSLLLLAACSSKGGDKMGPDAGPMLNFAWDWTGIVGTGQSLSVGGGDSGHTNQPAMQLYNNLKLALNGAVVPPFDPTIASLSMVPLTEPIRPTDPGYPSAYPGNLDGETPHTAMSDQITKMVMDAGNGHDYITAHTVVGESGMPMSVIKKNGVFPPPGTANSGTGGRAYAATLFEVAAIARLATAMGKTYGLGGITLIHGEADAGNVNYADDIFQLFTDYNTDLPALTGQTAKIPMFVSQQNSVPSGANSAAISSVQQWLVGVQHPGDVTCVGPKYQYDYSGDGTRVHLSAREYDEVGEKMAQVYFERVVLGHDWQPLQPINGTVSGNTITLQFHVPVPPLVWDDNMPPPHASGPWATGRGFEVSAAGPAQTIDSVAITAPDTVTITCHNDLTGLAVTVAYALTTDGVASPNGTYRWGHLKDSDPFVGSVTNTPQPNWAVAFSKDLF